MVRFYCAPASVLGLEPLEKVPEPPDRLPWRAGDSIGLWGFLKVPRELPWSREASQFLNFLLELGDLLAERLKLAQ